MSETLSPKAKRSKPKKKTQAKPINKETLRLAQVFGFTPKDLHYNRHGAVSREQHKKVVGSIRLWTIIYAVGFVLTGTMGLVFLIVAFNDGFDLIDIIADGWAVLLVGFLMPIGLVFKLWNNVKAMKAVNTGAAYQYQGPITKKVEKNTDSRGRTSIEYMINLGSSGVSYSLKEREYKEFKHGVIYIFYLVPRYKRFLSVEVVGSEFG